MDNWDAFWRGVAAAFAIGAIILALLGMMGVIQ